MNLSPETLTRRNTVVPWLARAAALGAMVTGGMVLLGWAFDIAILKSLSPDWVTMKANTAACFVLTGLSLWLACGKQISSRRRWLGAVLGGTAALIGLATLAEYVLQTDFGIDQLLVVEPASSVHTISPGRMSPTTAVSFLLLGLALVGIDWQTRRGHRPAQALPLPVLVICLLAAFGYLYGEDSFFNFAGATAIALHSALLFIVLALGLICARPGQGIMGMLTRETVGGSMARRLLPFVVGVPMVLSWLRMKGEQAGLFDHTMGFVMFSATNVLIFSMVVLATAVSLDWIECRREQAEAQILQLNAELNQRVQQRTAELEQANRELESFSYSVSHDLRSPLRGITGYISMIEEDYGPQLDAEGKRMLGVVSSEARRMGRLVDDLLAFSRLSRLGMATTSVNLTELVRESFADVTRDTKATIPCLDLQPLPETLGDPAMLRQVFINLLGNAVKFSRHQPAPVIEVGQASTPDGDACYVKDNGVGFDEQYVHKLFGVFQRLHSEAEFEGTGVGLALVQRIIHRHGGKIWAHSKLSEGATFFFTLPKPPETNS